MIPRQTLSPQALCDRFETDLRTPPSVLLHGAEQSQIPLDETTLRNSPGHPNIWNRDKIFATHHLAVAAKYMSKSGRVHVVSHPVNRQIYLLQEKEPGAFEQYYQNHPGELAVMGAAGFVQGPDSPTGVEPQPEDWYKTAGREPILERYLVMDPLAVLEEMARRGRVLLLPYGTRCPVCGQNWQG